MKRLITILVSIILIVSFFVFGIKYYNSFNSNFQYDGYVIDTKTGNKQYFLNNSEYKINETSKKVKFENSDKENQSISNATFVHYLDGSLSVFKKSAVINLDDMNKKSFQYYTVYAGSVFTKSGDEYRISYLDKQLSFSEFIIKISPDKYLVASPKLKIQIGEETQDVKAGFVELTYSDGNIVKLQNQEIDISNVSSKIKLSLNDSTYIDVEKKKIYYNDKEKINLGEITIDSNDNIDIVRDDENTKIDDEKNKEKDSNKTDEDNENSNNNQNTNNNNNQNSAKNKTIHQGDFEEVANGLIDAAEMEVETIVEENAAIKDAEFTVEEFNVTANSMNASVSVKDEEAVLTGALSIKVIKASTNEVVYYEQDSSGSNNIQVEVMTLTPQTNYILVMNRDYVKNNVTYNKDFIQKTFVTSSLGINIERDYVRTNESSINIVKNDYSKVTKASYKLEDNSTKETIEEGEIEFGNDLLKNLDFLNLKSNHNYTLTLSSIVYGNTIIYTNGNDYIYKFKTLKNKPTVGPLSFSASKKNSKITINLNNVKDNDGGVISYRADLYEISSNKYITSKTSNTNANIEFNVDGEVINRNTNYRAYVYLVFNDNEKEYEIPIGSQEVNVTGVEGPTATFYSDEITFERIKGRIIIQDKNNTINANKTIYVSYQNMSVGAEPITVPYNVSFADNKAIIEFDRNNLRSTDSYLFTVKATVDYHDDNGESLVDISQFIVQTGSPKPLNVVYNDRTSEFNEESFCVEMKLDDSDESNPSAYEASTMKSIQFRLYNDSYNPSEECTASNGCWQKRYFDQNIDDNDDYNSSLKSEYYDQTFRVTQDTVGATTNEITYGQYFLEVTGAYDYTDYKNELPIVTDKKIVISANNASGTITNKNVPADVQPIYNNRNTYDFLDKTTQIGFKVTANLLTNVFTDRIVYQIYNADTNKLVLEQEALSSDGSVPSATFNISNSQNDPLKRGGNYYFKYTIYYFADGASKSEVSENTAAFETKKQAPKIEMYQYDRDTTKVTFKYKFKDIDNAVDNYTGNSPYLYFYKNSEVDDYKRVVLPQTTGNDEKTIDIPFGYGTLHAYVQYKIKETGTEEKLHVINYYFSEVYETIGNIKYTFENGENASYIKFDNLSSIQQRNIVYMDIILSNGNKKVELKNKKLDNNNRIEINYTSIKELKSLNEENKLDISADIKVYFDSGLYGVNAPTFGYGSAFQLVNYSYSKYGEEYAYNLESADYINRKLVYKPFHDNNNTSTKSFNYELDNGYMVFEGEKTSIKVLNLTTASCTDNCTFWFDEIKPTMEISSESVGVTTFAINGKISGIEEEYIPNFKIKADVNLCTDTECTSFSPIDSTTWTLENFNTSSTPNKISNLTPNTTYRIYYHWTYDEIHYYDFYYSSTGGNNYYSQFTTNTGLHLKNAYAKYYANPYYNKRQLSLSYLIGILDGYDGIEYYMYYINENNEKVQAMEIPTDSLSNLVLNTTKGRFTKYIDIYEKLEAGKLYYIDIKPYYTVGGVKQYLDSLQKVKFNFLIKNPTISVSRVSDIDDNKFSVRVMVSDTFNALGSHRTYKVYTVSNDVTTELGEGQSGTPTIFENAECTGTSCDIKVVYASDLINNGDYTEYSSTHNVTILSNIYIGTPAIYATGDTSSIGISFTDFYKIELIDRISYTIYDSTLNVVASVDTFTPVWNSASTFKYILLPENLGEGSYLIQMQLYSNDELVGNATLDYAKG